MVPIRFAFVQDGNLTLNGVSVAENIAAHGQSQHLTFAAGSRAGFNITNLGNDTGLVSVTGGEVGGNLIGIGNSITAMSGGHVIGFPVFRDHATFLYSGGTFDLFGIPQAGAAASLRGLADGAGGDDGEPGPTQLPGFTIFDDAEVQFIGFGLQSTLVDPNFIDGRTQLQRLPTHRPPRRWLDHRWGIGLHTKLQSARFELIEVPVPEPASIALLQFRVFAAHAQPPSSSASLRSRNGAAHETNA